MEAVALNGSMFSEIVRDTDGQKKVKLYNNTGSSASAGSPFRWIPGTSGRDELASIVASLDTVQIVVFPISAIANGAWGWCVVDGPIQSRDESSAHLASITVPSGTYTAGNGLQVDPFSAALRDSGVPFDFADESMIGEIVATTAAAATSCQVRLYGRPVVFHSKMKRRVRDLFRTRPLFVDDDGDGAPTGTTGDVNIMKTDEADYEYVVLGAGQTVVKPVWATTGLSIEGDQTDNEGWEITNGIDGTLCRFAFTVGTDAAYFKVKLKIPDVSETDDLAIGFRKAAAYTAAIDDYTDFAVLNIIAGDIFIETALNNAATVSTDTTDNWADNATKTVEIYVSKAGAVTYKVDGAAPTTVASFTFDSGDVIIPFLYFLHLNSSANAVLLLEWQVGIHAGSAL